MPAKRHSSIVNATVHLQSDVYEDEVEELLSFLQLSHPSFSMFDARDIALLAESFSVTKFTAGQKVVQQGESATWFGIVLRGSLVDVSTETSQETVPAGTIIGELAVVEKHHARQVTLEGREDGLMASLLTYELPTFVAECPETGVKLLHMVAEAAIRSKLETRRRLRVAAMPNSVNWIPPESENQNDERSVEDLSLLKAVLNDSGFLESEVNSFLRIASLASVENGTPVLEPGQRWPHLVLVMEGVLLLEQFNIEVSVGMQLGALEFLGVHFVADNSRVSAVGAVRLAAFCFAELSSLMRKDGGLANRLLRMACDSAIVLADALGVPGDATDDQAPKRLSVQPQTVSHMPAGTKVDLECFYLNNIQQKLIADARKQLAEQTAKQKQREQGSAAPPAATPTGATDADGGCGANAPGDAAPNTAPNGSRTQAPAQNLKLLHAGALRQLKAKEERLRMASEELKRTQLEVKRMRGLMEAARRRDDEHAEFVNALEEMAAPLNREIQELRDACEFDDDEIHEMLSTRLPPHILFDLLSFISSRKPANSSRPLSPSPDTRSLDSKAKVASKGRDATKAATNEEELPIKIRHRYSSKKVRQAASLSKLAANSKKVVTTEAGCQTEPLPGSDRAPAHDGSGAEETNKAASGGGSTAAEAATSNGEHNGASTEEGAASLSEDVAAAEAAAAAATLGTVEQARADAAAAAKLLFSKDNMLVWRFHFREAIREHLLLQNGTPLSAKMDNRGNCSPRSSPSTELRLQGALPSVPLPAGATRRATELLLNRQSPRPTTTGGLCGGAGGASCLESSTVSFDGSPRGKSRMSASAQRGSSARLASAVTKRFCRDDADAAVMAIDEAVAHADWRQWLKLALREELGSALPDARVQAMSPRTLPLSTNEGRCASPVLDAFPPVAKPRSAEHTSSFFPSGSPSRSTPSASSSQRCSVACLDSHWSQISSTTSLYYNEQQEFDEAPPEAEGRESLSGMYMNFIKTRMINANGAPAALSPVRTPTGRPYASARSQ